MIGSILLLCLFLVAVTTTGTYFTNRSRCTIPEAALRTGTAEGELRALIQKRLLSIRPKYLFFGPLTVNPDAIAEARQVSQEIDRIRAEGEAKRRKIAEDGAAQIADMLRRHEADIAAKQEELERTKRMHAEILRRLQTTFMPDQVRQAFQVLGLAPETPFDGIRQRYRQLVKQHHPDAGGDPQRFIHIQQAYDRIVAWIQSQS
ncbi:DnaJ domain-containing protein [Ktedonospora formicarum]|uniref:J domain-containing protein n=1 Tax=Ktedonospora formicarum TaxID=2778364 RepID=A0A8J3I7Y2_9CHLR|nr:DnaJ domain-containing protein [Ktedonospora formicarum]GHO48510.1 hypothetical protein KSX_66730 [Ktedonospora formicarum]